MKRDKRQKPALNKHKKRNFEAALLLNQCVYELLPFG
jgi:hypothetical protein